MFPQIESSEHAYFLWLLLLLPVIPVLSFFVFRKTAWLSTLFRMLVCAAVIFAMADPQRVKETKETDVIFLVDQSDSLGGEGKQRAWEFARTLASQKTSGEPKHRLGAVVFGKDSLIQMPLTETGGLGDQIEVQVDGTQSNVAAALRFTGSLFDRIANRRIVLITDGESTDPDLVLYSQQLADAGIEIDVAKLSLPRVQDVVVEAIDTPARSDLNAPIHVSVRLKKRNSAAGTVTKGRLVVQRVQGPSRQTIADGPVELTKEVEVIPIRDTLDNGGMVVYEARFVAEDPDEDAYLQNNQASSIVEVAEPGKILVMTSQNEVAGVTERLEFLKDHGFGVEVRSDGESFANLADLLGFEAIFLVNAPRMQMVDDLPMLRYSDSQLEDLRKYVHDFGGGLLMVGGPQSMGPGGWMNTPVEEAMPVRFQVDNEKLVSTGALALVIDKSGSMMGDKIAMCQAAAVNALSMLADTDSLGVYPFDGELNDPIRIRKIEGNRSQMQRKIRQIGADGGTNMAPALTTAYSDLVNNNASLKHVIVLTDGQTAGSNFEQQAAAMLSLGITTSTVCVGADADKKLLEDIARNGGGRFYQVTNTSTIPRIFMKETRMMARPLIQEFQDGVGTSKSQTHEITDGLPADIPLVSGLVLSTIKENVLTQSLLLTDLPNEPNNTLLASWQYGSGRSAVWASDLGERWATSWRESGALEQIVTQSLRWIRRNHVKHNHFVQVDTGSGAARIMMQWDEIAAEVPASLQCIVAGIGNSERRQVTFQRNGPRQFEAYLHDLPTGSFALAVDTGGENGVVTQGFTVEDTREFEKHVDSMGALISVAQSGSGESLNPANLRDSVQILEEKGRWFNVDSANADEQTESSSVRGIDLFRPTATSDRNLSSLWPVLLLVAASLFLTEICIRKFGLDRWFSPSPHKVNTLPRSYTEMPDGSKRSDKRKQVKVDEGLVPEESLSYTERLLKTKKQASKETIR